MHFGRLIGGAIAAAMAFAAAPSLAHPDGPADHAHKAAADHAMSDADKAKAASCHAMPHADAMKDAKCAELMKAHGDMKPHDDMKHAEPPKHNM